MKNRHSIHGSSLLVSFACITALGILAFAAALYGTPMIFALLMALFLITLSSRIWAGLSAKGLEAEIKTRGRSLFTGQEIDIVCEIRNKKLLPLSWLDLFLPLPKNLAVVTDEMRKPDQWEVIPLAAEHFSTEFVGTMKLGSMLWYEQKEVRIPIHAKRRGVCRLDSWTMRTGDGLGLSETDIEIRNGGTIIVYPELIDVNVSPFLRNLWNSDTGAHGMMEDLTVIRSTRDYQTGDPLRHINWRLLARALPLSVNIYEDILPKSIHMIFDGESFSGPKAHKDEMEEMISILASELLKLDKQDVRCYLSICSGSTGKARCILPGEGVSEALYALSVYEPLEEKLNEAGTEIVRQKTEFDLAPIVRSSSKVGHFFYFSFDAADFSNAVKDGILEDDLTLISYIDTRERKNITHLGADRLRGRGK